MRAEVRRRVRCWCGVLEIPDGKAWKVLLMYASEAPCSAGLEEVDRQDDDNPLMSIVSTGGRREFVGVIAVVLSTATH